MANPRRNVSQNALTTQKSFTGTLRRMGASNFTLESTRNANVTRVNVTRKDGTTSSFNAPTDTARGALAAKNSGAIRGSGSAVDK